jgi:hypothetical protein
MYIQQISRYIDLASQKMKTIFTCREIHLSYQVTVSKPIQTINFKWALQPSRRLNEIIDFLNLKLNVATACSPDKSVVVHGARCVSTSAADVTLP